MEYVLSGRRRHFSARWMHACMLDDISGIFSLPWVSLSLANRHALKKTKQIIITMNAPLRQTRSSSATLQLLLFQYSNRF